MGCDEQPRCQENGVVAGVPACLALVCWYVRLLDPGRQGRLPLRRNSTPERKPRPGVGRQRLLVNQCRGRRVLKRGAGGIEDDDLVIAFSAGAAAGDDFTEFRANVVARNETARDGVMQ